MCYRHEGRTNRGLETAPTLALVPSSITRDRVLAPASRGDPHAPSVYGIPRKCTGFSFVEMVVVIAVLGILAAGSVRFLHFAAEGYGSAGGRAELSNTASTAMARMAIELEDALPYSVRVSGACIEFVPVNAVTRYLSLPLASTGTTVELVAPDTSGAMLASARLVVDAESSTKLYDETLGHVSPTTTFAAPDAGGVITATLSSAYAFASESPQRRVYVVSAPTSFCVDGARLFRYTNYGWLAAQATAALLPATSPDRQLVADNIAAGSTPFAVLAPSLARNNIVAITLSLSNGHDLVALDTSVHMRHVP